MTELQRVLAWMLWRACAIATGQQRLHYEYYDAGLSLYFAVYECNDPTSIGGLCECQRCYPDSVYTWG